MRNKSDVEKNKLSALSKMDNFLNALLNDGNSSHLKKVDLISYWLRDFANFIDFEEKFDAKRNIAYKRGNILKVNFGFNVGSEFGGLHYAVVLDKYNEHNSPVVTVIPLTSNVNSHRNNIDIGNDLYLSVISKATDAIDELKKSNKKAAELRTNIFNKIKFLDDITDDEDQQLILLREIERFNRIVGENEKSMEYAEKIIDEIKGMKSGTSALTGQIRTISKIRIYDPRVRRDVLSGVSLSADAMDKINDRIRDLFVF